jgi:O-antigen biosynthesis protein WbqP
MIRKIDFFLSLVSLIFFSPLFIIIFFSSYIETGSPIFVQKRLGKNMKIFNLFKFRTMKIDTLSVGSHLVDKNSITKFGAFLRFTKLDEIPQLWNVLIGDMSLVGPRPCLTNQLKLIFERKKKKIFEVLPGITGLSQINGVDMSLPKLQAEIDATMIKKMNIFFYIYILFMTLGRLFWKNNKVNINN